MYIVPNEWDHMTHVRCVYVYVCVCVCVCVCACSTHSVDHLFLVCAFVFASAIINYNQYLLILVSVPFLQHIRKGWSRNASACLYMCVYN